MNRATSALENNTALARRALVQQNWWSSWPIMWNTSTGFPDALAAAKAAWVVGCQRTLPGSTRGFVGFESTRALGVWTTEISLKTEFGVGSNEFTGTLGTWAADACIGKA